jgi:hypothetical protein
MSKACGGIIGVRIRICLSADASISNKRFKSPGSAQRFLYIHAAVYNLFNIDRHLTSRRTMKEFRGQAFRQWMNQGAFLMRRLENVRGEFSLTTLAYNIRRRLPSSAFEAWQRPVLKSCRFGRIPRRAIAQPNQSRHKRRSAKKS